MRITHGTVNIVYLLLLCLADNINSDKVSRKKKNSDEIKNDVLPPCASCRLLVESFKKGMERTSRGKFEGGDSAWEEDKLGSYKKSEVRLIEIQEKLCKDVDQGQNQCYALADEFEQHIEEWWFKRQDSEPNFFQYLCVESVERCCPPNKYGLNCENCPGYPDNVCNKNGKCKGAGTRKGSGHCTCDKGYTGKYCFECASGYYESYKDDAKLLCSSCHRACDGGCTGGGPKECHLCNSGWRFIEGKGCYDIDECIEKEDSCPTNHFCINNEGNYSCIACDRACDGCTGDGPDMCDNCAEGFKRKGNVCINADILGRKSHENWARYVTYLGLAVATCIIFQRNVYIASTIGLFVAAYISVSEYIIANTDIQDAVPNLDLLNQPS